MSLVNFEGSIEKNRHVDGLRVAYIEALIPRPQDRIKHNGEVKVVDTVEAVFRFKDHESIKRKFVPSLAEESTFVKFVRATMGEDVTYIRDIENMLLNKKLIVKLENNTVDLGYTQRTYTNIVEFLPISMMEELGLVDETGL